jgi:hypothetical protein
MRDGRVGSGWRHIKEISDIGNNKKLFIDGIIYLKYFLLKTCFKSNFCLRKSERS